MCAMLEEAGYRRDEIRGLTRGYVRRVLQHPRDDEGGLELQYHDEPGSAEPTPEERYRRKLWLQNYPEHLRAARLAEILRRVYGG